MNNPEFKPLVPADTDLKEFTFKAVFLGVIMAVILGAANAYIGMVAGLTIAATFPAAVVAIAVLRPMAGSILEENVARTTASVGEALVAGAIFTIPAFVIAGVWESVNFWISSFIMVVGGVLGVLFVIILRRTLVEESGLPFPESVAASEIHKAGQAGGANTKYLVMAGLVAGFIELLKNSSGIRVLASQITGFWSWGKSQMVLGAQQAQEYTGGIFMSTPSASPALFGVGYIIGPRLAAVVFAGGVLGWWCLAPIMAFVNRDLLSLGETQGWANVALNVVWQEQVRPLAVGTMVVSALWTLWTMRKSLLTGFGRVFSDLREVKLEEVPNRHEMDIRYRWIVWGIIGLLIPITALYVFFSQSFGGSIVAALVMVVAGILFAAVAGYLVGLIGSSNNPISGLTLSTLIVAALLMVAIGLRGDQGVLAVLGVAAVVCCAMGIAGDMMQDLKVGHILGGTPREMQKGELIAAVVAAPVLALVLLLLGEAYGFAGAPGVDPARALPAPQAGLMALVSDGIVSGEMVWPLFLAGMMFALMLILVRAPSPMLVAVGMYLPIWSTFAIFIGGVFRWIVDALLARRGYGDAGKERAQNTGTLIASGFIAGEALMGILIAGVIVANIELPVILSDPTAQGLLGLLVFPLALWMFYNYSRKEADAAQQQ
ncbi:oligopeptide transporter, OPT family [candidate division KSB1 bacterium]|nr:oligopeptide transporter, OPT family [candidate division KSB1 bacterium]NIR71165.1 oligopeptide transporter, OPT family [candidate division KSB1 bacterium]NIS23295.1 oligopeptide transporter, OPT family [candidate division KSB1 bacterium]NIT70174.1 oligopeptide transporter, OPT family [candidate division KSB1 bacterium]NIU23825.1 oligopeptide transporter, OPT family [candidate division KSB1 bacterium]